MNIYTIKQTDIQTSIFRAVGIQKNKTYFLFQPSVSLLCLFVNFLQPTNVILKQFISQLHHVRISIAHPLLCTLDLIKIDLIRVFINRIFLSDDTGCASARSISVSVDTKTRSCLEAFKLRHGGKAGPATQPTAYPDRGINRHDKVNVKIAPFYLY